MSRKLSALAVGLVLGTIAVPAAAQDAPELRVGLQVEREVIEADASGEPQIQRRSVDSATAGDVLVYTLEIVNEGGSDAQQARVVDPVPEGTVLIPDSVKGPGADVTYSVDGGETFAPYPITEAQVGPDGQEHQVPVPAESYTHVRWTLNEPLAPGQTRTANFKVRVL